MSARAWELQVDAAVSAYVAKRWHLDPTQRGSKAGSLQFLYPLFHVLYRVAEVSLRVTAMALLLAFTRFWWEDHFTGKALHRPSSGLAYLFGVVVCSRISTRGETQLVHMAVGIALLLANAAFFVDMPGFCYPAQRVSWLLECWRFLGFCLFGVLVVWELQEGYAHQDKRWDDFESKRWKTGITVLGSACALYYTLRLSPIFRKKGDDLHSAVIRGKREKLRKLLLHGAGGVALDVNGPMKDNAEAKTKVKLKPARERRVESVPERSRSHGTRKCKQRRNGRPRQRLRRTEKARCLAQPGGSGKAGGGVRGKSSSASRFRAVGLRKRHRHQRKGALAECTGVEHQATAQAEASRAIGGRGALSCRDTAPLSRAPLGARPRLLREAPEAGPVAVANGQPREQPAGASARGRALGAGRRSPEAVVQCRQGVRHAGVREATRAWATLLAKAVLTWAGCAGAVSDRELEILGHHWSAAVGRTVMAYNVKDLSASVDKWRRLLDEIASGHFEPDNPPGLQWETEAYARWQGNRASGQLKGPRKVEPPQGRAHSSKSPRGAIFIQSSEKSSDVEVEDVRVLVGVERRQKGCATPAQPDATGAHAIRPCSTVHVSSGPRENRAHRRSPHPRGAGRRAMSAAGCSGAASAEIDEATAPAWELPASPSWSAGLDTSIRSAATSVSVLSAGGRPCAGRGEGDTQHLRLAHENDALRERLRQLERQLGHDRAGPAAVPSGGASAGAEPAEPTRHALPPRHAALGGAHEPLPGAPAAGKPTPLGSTDGAGAVPALDMTYRSSPPRAAYPQELDALGASGLRRVAATVAQAAAEAAAGSASLEGTPRTELPALGPRFPLWSAKQDMPTEGEEGRSMLKAPLHELQDPSWQPEPLDLPGGRRARAAGPPEGCAAEAAAAGAAGQQQHHPEGCPESSSARAACAEEGLAVTDGSAAPAPPALQALRSCLQRQRQGCAAPPHGRQPEGDEDAERAKAVRRRKHNKIPGASRGASEKPPAARAHFAAYAEVYAPLVPSPRSAAMATPTLPSAACASPSAPPREEPRAAQPPAWDTPAPASGQHSPLAAAQLEAQAWDKVGPSTPDAARGLAAAAGRAAPECPVEAQPLTE
ncbi:unnamed protein product, partial [Prorocentrum cordatum]